MTNDKIITVKMLFEMSEEDFMAIARGEVKTKVIAYNKELALLKI